MPVLSVVNTYSAVITLGRTIRPDDALMFRMLIDVNQCPMAWRSYPCREAYGLIFVFPGGSQPRQRHLVSVRRVALRFSLQNPIPQSTN